MLKGGNKICGAPTRVEGLHPSIRLGGGMVIDRCQNAPLARMVVCVEHATEDALRINIEQLDKECQDLRANLRTVAEQRDGMRAAVRTLSVERDALLRAYEHANKRVVELEMELGALRNAQTCNRQALQDWLDLDEERDDCPSDD